MSETTDKSYDNILGKLYDTPWYITQHGLELIASIVERKMKGEELPEDQMAEIVAKNRAVGQELELPKKPSVAVLPISGPMFPKANLMTALSGATSTEKLKSDFDKLMDSDMVKAIVLDIDSPGGAVTGTPELAQHIFEAREKKIKPIYAVATGTAASAAYYIGSQADKFIASPSAMVGSIGVVAIHTEQSKMDEKIGLKRTILSVGKHKADGNPYEELSDEAKAHRLETMQEAYDDFVSAVARGRNTTSEEVEAEYGQGRMFYPKHALKRGMIDSIETLESVVNGLSKPKTKVSEPFIMNRRKKEGAKMAELTPEILASLGLAEDATNEDVENAITELSSRPAATEDTASDLPIADLEKQFPQVAERLKKDNERIARLEAESRKNEAHSFAQSYAQFTSDKGKTGKGFSALALEQVEGIHLAIADGMLTHESFKKFLDNVASENAVVDYRELGSTRGEEDESDVSNGHDAAVKLRDLALAHATENGMSYGDALAAMQKAHPQLAKMYRESLPTGGEN